MSLWEGFIGPAYLGRNRNMAAEQAINLFVDTITEPAKRAQLLGTPGLVRDCSAADVVGRGVWSQDGLTLTVLGYSLYKRDAASQSLIYLGSVGNDGGLCSFASNGMGGNQIGIVSAGQFYILNRLTLALSAPIVLPLTNTPVVVRYIGGYFLLLERESVRVWFSALENGTSWNALDFFARSDTADFLVGMEILANRIWVFGTQTSEIYYNSGDLNNPFVPFPSTVMQEGLVSPFAEILLGEAIVWVSQDNQGHARVVMASSPAPQRISNATVEYALAAASTLADCELLAYEQEGHAFAIVTAPSLTAFGNAGESWGVDLNEPGLPWHQRLSWNSTTSTFFRWRVRGLCNVGQILLVGDYALGVLGQLSLDTFTEYGNPMRWLRAGAYLSGENQLLFLDQLELGVQAGFGLTSGQGSAPQVMLELSGDFGETWTPPIAASVGAQGEYGERCMWSMLGGYIAGRLVARISQTDPVRPYWGPGLWLRATPGLGTL